MTLPELRKRKASLRSCSAGRQTLFVTCVSIRYLLAFLYLGRNRLKICTLYFFELGMLVPTAFFWFSFHFRLVKSNLLVRQVETVAQFGVIFLLFALGLEFSTTKVNLIHISLIYDLNIFCLIRWKDAWICMYSLVKHFLPVEQVFHAFCNFLSCCSDLALSSCGWWEQLPFLEVSYR